jgi:U3 small nucleolar RNA-associated protein 3
MIQMETALNVCQYLLIKAEQAKASDNNTLDNNEEDNDNVLINNQDEDDIKNHPVIKRLNQLNHIGDKLQNNVESKVNGLKDQVENLVKASSLMFGDEVDEEHTDNSEDEDSQDETESKQVSTLDAISTENKEEDSNDDASTASSEASEDAHQVQRNVMNEARFALRAQDDTNLSDEDLRGSKKRRRRELPSFTDYGDDDDVDQADLNKAAKSLASTVNTISQRRKKPAVDRNAEVGDDENEERFKRGLEMMEEDIGASFDGGEDIGMDDDELDDGLDNDFYSQIKKKSKEKKEFKKNMYAVAPKYPGMDDEIEGERSVGQMIMKNRGLVAHKSKLNRNPRVKKREQYRKAIIRRKGAVRDVRTDEGHKYGGEGTGIKSGLSRSRKL